MAEIRRRRAVVVGAAKPSMLMRQIRARRCCLCYLLILRFCKVEPVAAASKHIVYRPARPARDLIQPAFFPASSRSHVHAGWIPASIESRAWCDERNAKMPLARGYGDERVFTVLDRPDQRPCDSHSTPSVIPSSRQICSDWS